jgi:hypothetical protein
MYEGRRVSYQSTLRVPRFPELHELGKRIAHHFTSAVDPDLLISMFLGLQDTDPSINKKKRKKTLISTVS